MGMGVEDVVVLVVLFVVVLIVELVGFGVERSGIKFSK